ncbi:unnamed protein product [Calypogeia fissa]
MASFATLYPVLLSDGEQKRDMGLVVVHSMLTFKQFQASLAQKTGIPAGQLSAVFVYGRTLMHAGENKQKLPINKNTNFGMILNRHSPNVKRECYFLVSMKKRKTPRNMEPSTSSRGGLSPLEERAKDWSSWSLGETFFQQDMYSVSQGHGKLPPSALTARENGVPVPFPISGWLTTSPFSYFATTVGNFMMTASMGSAADVGNSTTTSGRALQQARHDSDMPQMHQPSLTGAMRPHEHSELEGMVRELVDGGNGGENYAKIGIFRETNGVTSAFHCCVDASILRVLDRDKGGEKAKTCRLGGIARDTNSGSPPFHCSVDDSILEGFNVGPSPFGPIGTRACETAREWSGLSGIAALSI